MDRYAELTMGKTKLTLMCNSKVKEYFGNQTQVFFGQRDDSIALCFRVRDVDEVHKQKKVEIVSPPWNFRDWGIKIALVRDPEGNLIELIQPAQIVGSE